mgnify:FL=1
MTNKLITAAAIACASLILASCGGGSSSDSRFFGNVPGLCAKWEQTNDGLKEKFKTADSAEAAGKIMDEANASKEEYKAKIEEAAKGLDGKTIEIQSTPQFTVNSPLTLTFDRMSSMDPRFKLAGDIVAGENYQSENARSLSDGSDPSRYKGLSQHVYLIGLDNEGNKVLESKIGYFPMDLINDTELGVKAGTPLELETFTIHDGNMEGCIKATTLQLSYIEK